MVAIVAVTAAAIDRGHTPSGLREHHDDAALNPSAEGAATHRVRLSTSTYTRIGTAAVNTPAEIDTALNSLADLTR